MQLLQYRSWAKYWLPYLEFLNAEINFYKYLSDDYFIRPSLSQYHEKFRELKHSMSTLRIKISELVHLIIRHGRQINLSLTQNILAIEQYLELTDIKPGRLMAALFHKFYRTQGTLF